MDIGDPSEIPTTRKKLPSMQELGAFDLDSPRAAASASKPAPTAPPPKPTGAQLRAAVERADPATRKKLLRLIAGGRTVEQFGGKTAKGTAGQAHRLAMNLRRSEAQAEASAANDFRQSAQAMQRPARSNPEPAGQTLLKIDANTDLLAAAAPVPSAEQRKAALQAQLAAARSQEAPRGETTSAHKVLFPAYDPRQHGEDVRRPARRGEAPVEGHFPAPRQPFQASYRHADGRPMNAEETEVEAVLQEARCEQTLEVLARDGVNGLLLSPRDLDAAVENGTLDEQTANLLWKTWSALRPVIHVIDDQPGPPAIDGAEPTAEPVAAEPDVEPAPPLECAGAAEIEFEALAAAEADPQAIAIAEDGPAAPLETPAQVPAISQHSATAEVPIAELAISTPPPSAPALEPQPAITMPGLPVEPATVETLAPASRRQGSVAWLRRFLHLLVALSILHSGAQIGNWAWLRWGNWLVG